MSERVEEIRRCTHNSYWRGVYDTCMACRAEQAEAALAQAEREREESRKDAMTAFNLLQDRAMKAERQREDLRELYGQVLVERNTAWAEVERLKTPIAHRIGARNLGDPCPTHAYQHCGICAEVERDRLLFENEQLRTDEQEAVIRCDAAEEAVQRAEADLARVRAALSDYLAPHRSNSHPGSGGDPEAAARLQRLRDELATLEGR